MAADTDPKLGELRTNVDKAIAEFVKYKAELAGTGDAIVSGWAAFAEYTTMELYHEDQSGNCVIIPDDQAATMSRGLFEFGVDAFRR